MPYLPYLSDEQLIAIVRSVVDAGAKAAQKADLGRNVIDPFAVLFEMAAFGLTEAAWEKNERTRQAQKTLVNQLGNMHQQVLGAVAGWEDLGVGSSAGCDLVNHERKIIAEVKNKHNTVKKSDEIGLYQSLHDLVMSKSSRYHGYTAYYVRVIPEKPRRHDLPLTPSDKKTGTRASSNERIRDIDGASFYALATGYDDALAQLHQTLPQVLAASYPKSAKHFSAATAQDYFTAAYGAHKA